MTNSRTLQETMTSLSGDEVLTRAKSFFSSRPSLYSTFLDKEGPGFASFRGQGGEEIVILPRFSGANNVLRLVGGYRSGRGAF